MSKNVKTVNPSYYSVNEDGDELFDLFEKGLLTKEQCRGFYIGSMTKYLNRYPAKNGVEDLNKTETYLQRLISFEERLGEIKGASTNTDDVDNQ